MRITVTSHKGGVGKTVSAVHLAGYLGERFGPGSTLLVDADPNRSALRWWSRGEGGTESAMPFAAVAAEEARSVIGRYEHTVIDTQGRVRGQDLERLARGCDLLVVPTMTSPMSLEAAMLLVADLEALGWGADYRVLITAVPPWWRRSGRKARTALERRGVPLFDTEIRDRVAFDKAQGTGVLVKQADDPRAHQGWEDYERVGEEMLAIL